MDNIEEKKLKLIDTLFASPAIKAKIAKKESLHLGPVIREMYQKLLIPDAPSKGTKAIIVGVVNERESEILKAKGYTVTLADVSPINDKVIQLDLTDPYDIYKAKYDLVVVSDVLEHIQQDVKAVKGAKELLKKGGLLYIHVPGGNADAPLTEHDKKEGHVRHGYAEGQIKEVINKVPFKSVWYGKTFNDVEKEAYFLSKAGEVKRAFGLLRFSPFDGKYGDNHVFLITNK